MHLQTIFVMVKKIANSPDLLELQAGYIMHQWILP